MQKGREEREKMKKKPNKSRKTNRVYFALPLPNNDALSALFFYPKYLMFTNTKYTGTELQKTINRAKERDEYREHQTQTELLTASTNEEMKE